MPTGKRVTRRSFLAGSAAFAGGVALAGCGGSDDNGDSPPAQSSRLPRISDNAASVEIDVGDFTLIVDKDPYALRATDGAEEFFSDQGRFRLKRGKPK